MTKLKHLALIVLVALLVGACGGAAPTETAPPDDAEPTAAAPTPTEEPADVLPTETAADPSPTETNPPQAPTATQGETAATQAPTPPQTPDFLQIRADDWVMGPADAEVTLIEYSDYQ